jgi:hypothetical protein
MRAWLKALWHETIFAWWAILSAVSTTSTFFIPKWSGRLRLLFSVSGIVAFGWANLRVFQKNQEELRELRNLIASRDSRVSELRIVEEPGSRFILSPAGNIPRSAFDGGYLEFHLMVENRGRRNSTVMGYQIEIVELGMIYRDLRPISPRGAIQGRHSQFGVNPSRSLTVTGNLSIPAESMTNSGELVFHLPSLSLEQFAEAHLNMRAEDRRFGPLRCRLTISDTTAVSASHEFIMNEA